MTSTRRPATVYLIRHGEKLGDPGSDKDGGPYLSTLGSARAAALPSLFMPLPPTPLDFPSCVLTPGKGELTISNCNSPYPRPYPSASRPLTLSLPPSLTTPASDPSKPLPLLPLHSASSQMRNRRTTITAL
jgi:hypothetical protein